MEREIEAVRDFTRFYTRHMGVLKEGLLDTRIPLPQARLVFELAQRDGATAAELAQDLSLDPAYVSRIMKQLDHAGLTQRTTSTADARQKRISLTPAGRACFADLDTRSRTEVASMLAGLPDADRAALVAAMSRIRRLLDRQGDAGAAPVVLRPHRPGDIGWVISRHGAIYAEEFGWDQTFEALVADIAAAFIRDFQPEWEQCWIAELDGRNAGSVFVVRKSRDIAQLRMLIVDPAARGHRIGEILVDTVIAFARARGYRTLTLWTNDCLHAARRIYQKAGFELVDEEKHHSFGVDLVGQNWDLAL
ncbi:bifunctional helix-turn-helix transcriptional regulator/GNAT family N-acetyltransferase [Minwuia sp.]|uniref:bifunctional helix-turn-helix transcriptional regulator/GNAT family N-acetyltransferase n=1 Tax=Minwuia sp. TaxID=2493630 RepID=UPI003A91C7DB